MKSFEYGEGKEERNIIKERKDKRIKVNVKEYNKKRIRWKMIQERDKRRIKENKKEERNLQRNSSDSLKVLGKIS